MLIADQGDASPEQAVAALDPGSRIAGTVNRNAACPCGSGQRYKACCGNVAKRAAGTAAPSIGSLMQRALTLQHEGRLVDAAALYRETLSLAPDLPDAVHMMGVTYLQAGEYGAALRHLRQCGRALRLAASRGTP